MENKSPTPICSLYELLHILTSSTASPTLRCGGLEYRIEIRHDELEKHMRLLSSAEPRPNTELPKDNNEYLKSLGYSFVNCELGEEDMETEKPRNENGHHIAFLFSSPLLFISRDSRINLMDSLECEKEYDKILSYMQSTKRAVKCNKWVASIDNLAQCLNERPLVLHFSGHGVVERSVIGGSRSEEYFLLFEDVSGTAKEVSKHQIQSIFQKYKHVPELVFISACYSGYLGQIFLDLGVNHVICVKLLSTVVDEVAAEFAKAFYTTLFSDCTSICDAFKVAKMRVASKYGPLSGLAQEVDKFTIRCKSNSLGVHECSPCPTIPYGVPIEHPPKRFSKVPAKVAPYIGRQKDMYAVLGYLMTSRVVTVVGLPGIGKSSLSVMLAHFLLEREQFSDGVIHVSIRDVRTVETLAHHLFDVIAQTRDASNNALKGEDENKLVLQALETANVLLILDNAEELISKNGAQLKEWIQTVLSKDQKVKILMTSRSRPNPFESLYSTHESVFYLHPLDPQSSVTLLSQMSPRPIAGKEIAELIKQDCSGTREGDGMMESLAKHKLTKVLAGHPCIISLAGALLQDRDLTQLYKILMQGVVHESHIMGPLKPRLIACMETLGQKSAMSMCFLKFMGFFQSPTKISTIEDIWGADCYDHIENLMNLCLIEEVAGDEGDFVHRKYYILSFIADYALGNLDIDVRELYDKCTEYYSDILEESIRNYVQSAGTRSISIECETEQNILSLLAYFEHMSKLTEAEQPCEAAKEADLPVKCDDQFPTFEAIESLKSMIKPIAEQLTYKRKARDSSGKSMIVGRYPLLGQVEEKSHKSLYDLKMSPDDDPSVKERIKSYGKLLVTYMATLIFLKRYAEADVIAVACSEHIKDDRLALANVSKLRGLISARIVEQKLKYPDYGQAKTHYNAALARFAELDCKIGAASCHIGLAEISSKEKSKEAKGYYAQGCELYSTPGIRYSFALSTLMTNLHGPERSRSLKMLEEDIKTIKDESRAMLIGEIIRSSDVVWERRSAPLMSKPLKKRHKSSMKPQDKTQGQSQVPMLMHMQKQYSAGMPMVMPTGDRVEKIGGLQVDGVKLNIKTPREKNSIIQFN